MKRRFKFGYRYENMKIIIVDEEQSIIKAIFEDYLAGMSTVKIANKLNMQPIRYNECSNVWSRGNVSFILKDITYLGNEYYPQIINIEQYEAVQCLTEQNVHKIPDAEKAHAAVYKDKSRCSVCGGVIIRKTMKKGQKDSVIMRCVNGYYPCRKVKISLIEFEHQIKNIFTMLSLNIDVINVDTNEKQPQIKDDETNRMINLLRMNMQDESVSDDEILKEIINISSKKFDACKTANNEKVTEKIKKIIMESDNLSRVNSECLDAVVQRIILTPEKTIVVHLKNGMEFTERMLANENNHTSST